MSHHCPSCGPAAPSLAAEHLASVDVERCPTCRGVWVGATAFGALAAEAARDGVHEEVDESAPASHEESVVYRSCPGCREPMNRVHFGHTSGVIVDVCRQHGLWFDHNELARVLAWVHQSGQTQAAPPSARPKAPPRRQPTPLDDLLPISVRNPGGLRFKGVARALLRWLERR